MWPNNQRATDSAAAMHSERFPLMLAKELVFNSPRLKTFGGERICGFSHRLIPSDFSGPVLLAAGLCVHNIYLERFWGVGVRLQTIKETSQMGTNNNQIPNPKESYFDSPSTVADWEPDKSIPACESVPANVGELWYPDTPVVETGIPETEIPAKF
jgi:hypothetical protein